MKTNELQSVHSPLLGDKIAPGSPLPHQPCQPPLPTRMSLELFLNHLGPTSGSTCQSPHLPFPRAAAHQGSKRKPQTKQIPHSESYRRTGSLSCTPAKNPSSAWPGEVRSLRLRKLGKPQIISNFFWGVLV